MVTIFFSGGYESMIKEWLYSMLCIHDWIVTDENTFGWDEQHGYMFGCVKLECERCGKTKVKICHR
jgi:hypothetical protein